MAEKPSINLDATIRKLDVKLARQKLAVQETLDHIAALKNMQEQQAKTSK